MKRVILVLIVFCISYTCTFPSSVNYAQTTVEAITPNLSQYDLRSIACNAYGLYAVVGKSGVILTSAGDSQWSMRKSGTVSSLCGITWGRGQFIAVGEKGTILRSSDGISWTPCTSDSSAGLFDVAWNGRQYAAAGKDGTILISYDGIKWKRVRMATGETLVSISWCNGKYITVGENEVILTSSDGLTWDTEMAEPFSDKGFKGAAASDDIIVVAGDNSRILSSRYSDTWQEVDCSAQIDDDISFSAVTRGYGLFVAVSVEGIILTSLDGERWNELPPGAWKGLRDVIWDGKCYIAVGDSGTVIISRDGKGWRSLSK